MAPLRGRRIALDLLPALLGLNAPAMLAAGPLWYAHTPGVVATGPYNAHFAVDIGTALTAATVGLLAPIVVADA